MDIFVTELRPPFQNPSEDVRLVILSDNLVRREPMEVKSYLIQCSQYACRNRVYLVSGLIIHDQNLCLSLFDPKGRAVCRQPALHLSPEWEGELLPGEELEVVHTDLGNLCLCVDADILYPPVARTAALKGADVLLSVQRVDPVEDYPGRLLCSVWEAAQSSNLYVANLSAGECTVCCPSPLTRARDGYLLRRPLTEIPPVRFGLNIERLDEVREGLPLLESLSPGLLHAYSQTFGGDRA